MNFENKSFVVVGGGRTDGICFNIVKQLIAGGTKVKTINQIKFQNSN